MKEVEKRLRDDAQAIRARVPDDLQQRIRRSIEATSRVAESVSSRRPALALPWRIAGAAVAAGIIAAVLMLPGLREPRPDAEIWSATPQPDAETTPLPAAEVSLQAEFALLRIEDMATTPLEQEQENLESDFQRIRRHFRRAF